MHNTELTQPRDETLWCLLDLLDEYGDAEVYIDKVRARRGDSTRRDSWQHGNRFANDELYNLAINRIVERWMHQEGSSAPIRVYWEMLYYSLLSCDSLRDALHRMVYFLHAGGLMKWRLEVFETEDFIEFRIGTLPKVENRLSFSIELIGAHNIYAMLGWLIGQALPLTDLQLVHPARFERYLIPGLFPLVPRFGASETVLQLPAYFGDFKIIRKSRDADEFLSRRLLPCQVSDDSKTGNLIHQVQQIIASSLASGDKIPSMEVLAESLHIGVSSLRRHLAGQGTSYRKLKDKCRRENAIRMLLYRDLSIEEISNRLAFYNSDAFRTAFRVWTGDSPSQFRRKWRNQ